MQNEKLTSKTPLLLTIAVILLVVLRITIWYIETYKIPEPVGIAWQEPSRADLAGVRDYQPKMVFYYFFEQQSEACQRVDHGALLSKNVVKIVNENFLPIKVLGSPDAELGKELRKRFGVLMCPTFVIALPNGNPIGTQAGYFGVSAQNLLSFIESCKRREAYVAGLDYLAHGQYEQAQNAFETWLEKKRESDSQVLDGTLYCAVAELMLFEENAAKQVLAKIKEGQYEKDSNWPQPLVQFLLRKLNAQDLFKSCENHSVRQAQSLYFIGMLELRNGNLPAAVDDFRRAEKTSEISTEIRNLIIGQLNIISQHGN